jgi:acetyltransferase-like isoleucine patch superfamily enzyme
MKHRVMTVLRKIPLLRQAAHAMRRLVTGIRACTLRTFSRGCKVTNRGLRNELCVVRSGRLKRLRVIFEGNDNSVEIDAGATITSCTITLHGHGNHVRIGNGTVMNTGIRASGDNNTVLFDDGCMITTVGLVCEDSDNHVAIGERTQIAGSTELAVMEGTAIRIGAGCLFSGLIHFRTGDSHSITDMDGRRVNPSRDIVLGDHVWVGRGATLLKGAAVADHSVIAACAVVTKAFDRPHCAIGGNPARVLREGIDWRVERLAVEPAAIASERAQHLVPTPGAPTGVLPETGAVE